MNFHRHLPAAPLSGFIEALWFYDGFYPDHSREQVLPDGCMQLLFELTGTPRQLFARDNATGGASFRGGWISGAHTAHLVIDALPNSSMMGAHFKPGGATAILGMPADELRDQVVQLDALWGRLSSEWLERLLAARGPAAKLRLLEQLLLARHRSLPAPRDQVARVQWAVQEFIARPHLACIRAASEQGGISHKHFIDEFRRQVGLTPKLFCRIRRFQQVLACIHRRKPVAWADVAASSGYFDQSHFVHDFREFAGFNPSVYLSHRVDGSNFIPLRD